MHLKKTFTIITAVLFLLFALSPAVLAAEPPATEELPPVLEDILPDETEENEGGDANGEGGLPDTPTDGQSGDVPPPPAFSGEEPGSITPANIINGYVVSGGTLTGLSYNSLPEAFSAINLDSGTEYTVTVADNDPALGALAPLAAGKNVTLQSDENGPYTITRASTFGSMLQVDAGASLTIQNLILDGGAIWSAQGVSAMDTILQRGTANSGLFSGAPIVYSYGVLILENGAVLQNNKGVSGGGVVSNGSFIMSTGSIIKNCSDNGNNNAGGANIIGGTFLLDGGLFAGCSASRGGAIAISAGAKLEMKSGKITNCYALKNGGGVYVGDRLFEMTGGSIEGNGCTSSGGGVAINGGTFILTDGTIANNTAAANGGGVWNSTAPDSLFVMHGGLISGNTAFYGGGVENNSYSTTLREFETSENGVISTRAGAVILGGTIAENSSRVQGGGIRNDSISNSINSHLLIDNCEITGNTSVSGAGAYLRSSAFSNTIYNSSINKNTSTGAGGGLYVYGTATLHAENIEVANNTARTNGGGLYMTSITGNKVIISDSVFKSNEAAAGGGVYVGTNANFTGTGQTSFIQNKATGDGGGIHTQSYSYGDPSSTQKYQNFSLEETTIFSGNTAGTLFSPPRNAADFTNIQYSATSVSTGGGNWLHPLNNFDINFKYGSPLEFVKATYHPNGAEGEIHEDWIAAGSSYQIPHSDLFSYSLKGHSFTAWNTTPNGDGTKYIPNYSFTIDADLDLYALWEEDMYTVVYNPGIGTGGTSKTAQRETAQIVLNDTEAGVSCEGHTFLGWGLTPNGSVVYTGAESIGSDAAKNDVITLYALWDRILPPTPFYTVTYHPNGGTGGQSDASLLEGTSYTIKNNTAASVQRNGYTFIGWNTAPDGSGTAYSANTQTVINGNLTLYAQWEATQSSSSSSTTSSSSGSSSNPSTSPATGDSNSLPLWFGLLFISAALLALGAGLRRKQKANH